MLGYRAMRRTTTSGRAAPPPPVVGAPRARLRDSARLTWWHHTGFRHGAIQSHGAQCVYGYTLTALWWVAAPLLLAVQALMLTRKTTTYYLSPQRDAAIAVTATRRGWTISDHLSAAPGTGQGRRLRAVVAPALLVAADGQGVDVHLVAATPGLAIAYTRDLPGLMDVGAAWPRGRQLLRPARRAPEHSQPFPGC